MSPESFRDCRVVVPGLRDEGESVPVTTAAITMPHAHAENRNMVFPKQRDAVG